MADEREELPADVRDELESITMLVGELVELARGEEPEVAPSEFRLDDVVQAAVDRAARRAPGAHVPDAARAVASSSASPSGSSGRSRICSTTRASGARRDETVDVAVRDGLVEVRDRGPGIAAEDLPLVFNRFYRSARARGMPGAGLGLAIVKQIADAHGGTVTIDQAPDGGAILRLRFLPIR